MSGHIWHNTRFTSHSCSARQQIRQRWGYRSQTPAAPHAVSLCLTPTMLAIPSHLCFPQARLAGDDPAAHAAALPLHLALLPLLHALANIAADPAQALLVLSELQAQRPLPPTPPSFPTTPVGPATVDPAGPSTSTGVTSPATATCLAAVHTCLAGGVGHRGVQRAAGVLVAGLAWGCCRAGSVAVDACRGVLRENGMVAALVSLLRRAALDIRKEAAAALLSLCHGAEGAAGGSAGEASPGAAQMLKSLGIGAAGPVQLPGGGAGQEAGLGVGQGAPGDEHGVLAAFVSLLRSPDADAVHMVSAGAVRATVDTQALRLVGALSYTSSPLCCLPVGCCVADAVREWDIWSP